MSDERKKTITTTNSRISAMDRRIQAQREKIHKLETEHRTRTQNVIQDAMEERLKHRKAFHDEFNMPKTIKTRRRRNLEIARQGRSSAAGQTQRPSSFAYERVERTDALTRAERSAQLLDDERRRSVIMEEEARIRRQEHARDRLSRMRGRLESDRESRAIKLELHKAEIEQQRAAILAKRERNRRKIRRSHTADSNARMQQRAVKRNVYLQEKADRLRQKVGPDHPILKNIQRKLDLGKKAAMSMLTGESLAAPSDSDSDADNDHIISGSTDAHADQNATDPEDQGNLDFLEFDALAVTTVSAASKRETRADNRAARMAERKAKRAQSVARVVAQAEQEFKSKTQNTRANLREIRSRSASSAAGGGGQQQSLNSVQEETMRTGGMATLSEYQAAREGLLKRQQKLERRRSERRQQADSEDREERKMRLKAGLKKDAVLAARQARGVQPTETLVQASQRQKRERRKAKSKTSTPTSVLERRKRREALPPSAAAWGGKVIRRV